ncbi:MAG TPA: hypothetical protein VLB73_00675 [Patescibacteria group bacterium]|nr:hypothetical protein [Patescibacteria group bacterium]
MAETSIHGPCLLELKRFGESNFRKVGSCGDCPHAQMARRMGIMLAGYAAFNNTVDHDMSAVIQRMESVSKTLKLADIGLHGCRRSM